MQETGSSENKRCEGVAHQTNLRWNIHKNGQLTRTGDGRDVEKHRFPFQEKSTTCQFLDTVQKKNGFPSFVLCLMEQGREERNTLKLVQKLNF